MRQGWRISFQENHERKVREDSQPEGDSDCARGTWCAQATREKQPDGTIRRTPAKTPRSFCAADELILETCLSALPPLYGRLSRALGDHVTSEVLVRSPFGPGVEIRTDVDEIMRAVVDGLMTWLERVSVIDPSVTAPDTSWWRRKSLGARAGELAAYAVPRLRHRVTALTVLRDEPMLRPAMVAALGCGTVLGSAGEDTVWLSASGADAGNELMRVEYLGRAALGETNPLPVALLGVECPECGHRSLRRAAPPQHDGDPVFFASCGDCQALVTDEDYRAWTSRLVRFYSSRVNPYVLAAAGLRGDESRAVAEASGVGVAA